MVVLSIAAPVLAAPYGKPITFNVNVTGAKPTSGTAPILVDGTARGVYDFGAGAGSVTIPAGLNLDTSVAVTIANVTQGGSVYSFTSDTVAITLTGGDPEKCKALATGGCDFAPHNKKAEICADCGAEGPSPHVEKDCPNNATKLDGPGDCLTCNSLGVGSHNPILCDRITGFTITNIRCAKCDEVGGANYWVSHNNNVACPASGTNPGASVLCGILDTGGTPCGASDATSHGASGFACANDGNGIYYISWVCGCGANRSLPTTNPAIDSSLHNKVKCTNPADLKAKECDDCGVVGPVAAGSHDKIVECNDKSSLAGKVECPGGLPTGGTIPGTESYLVNGSANGFANLVGSTGTVAKKEWTFKIPVSFKPEKGSAKAPNNTRFMFDYTLGTDSTFASTSYITGGFGGYGGGYFGNGRGGYNGRRAPGSYSGIGYDVRNGIASGYIAVTVAPGNYVLNVYRVAIKGYTINPASITIRFTVTEDGRIRFNTNATRADFTYKRDDVAKKPAHNNPKTGDATNVALWSSMAVTSMAGVVVALKKRMFK
ncbi:MAG: hypothetical protein FWG10_13500 [Eubacteriaceae bacterium]|nr:hypothetical protein [Eubacteriaceae bacterium]